MTRRAFSLAELLIVLFLLGILIALLLLRVSGSRESSRRVACEANLRSLFVAVESYSLQYGHLPTGTQNAESPIRSEPKGYHHNWITGLLPQLEQQALYEQVDFTFGVYAEANAPVSGAFLDVLHCPAAEDAAPNATTYTGVCSSIEAPISGDSDGMFVLNRTLSERDATDGKAYVLMVGEKAIDFGPVRMWNSGTRASLRTAGVAINSGPPNDFTPELVGGFSSRHVGGAYFLTLAGEFRFITEDIDPALLQQLAARADSTEAAETNE